MFFLNSFCIVLSCRHTHDNSVTEHEHAHLVMIHLVMMTRNMLKRPSNIDNVRLGNAFSSKESSKTLRALNIDQALVCVLKVTVI